MPQTALVWTELEFGGDDLLHTVPQRGMGELPMPGYPLLYKALLVEQASSGTATTRLCRSSYSSVLSAMKHLVGACALERVSKL
jgi:hypothetical protein